MKILYTSFTKSKKQKHENKQKGETNIEFPYQVPESEYFVLSDERDKTTDSRNEDIGLIKKDNVIGKVIFRVWPFKKLGAI